MANTISMEFAMMSYQSKSQPKLFYYNVNLGEKIPQKHILSKIKEKTDFDFIYAEVKDTYGTNGNVSVVPPVILRMMLLLVLLLRLPRGRFDAIQPCYSKLHPVFSKGKDTAREIATEILM